MITQADRKDDNREFREERESLWRLTLAPSAWALHFAISYAASAIVCAKFADPAAFTGLRLGLGALTIVALAIIAWLGLGAWRAWDFLGDFDDEHRLGEAEDRHRFLNHAAFLLVVVSFIGVIFVAMPLVYLGTCR